MGRRLTPEQVEQVRRYLKQGLSHRQTAARADVGRSAVEDIAKGRFTIKRERMDPAGPIPEEERQAMPLAELVAFRQEMERRRRAFYRKWDAVDPELVPKIKNWTDPSAN